MRPREVLFVANLQHTVAFMKISSVTVQPVHTNGRLTPKVNLSRESNMELDGVKLSAIVCIWREGALPKGRDDRRQGRTGEMCHLREEPDFVAPHGGCRQQSSVGDHVSRDTMTMEITEYHVDVKGKALASKRSSNPSHVRAALRRLLWPAIAQSSIRLFAFQKCAFSKYPSCRMHSLSSDSLVERGFIVWNQDGSEAKDGLISSARTPIHDCD